MVRPKKSLGQHFLRDDNIARKIVGSLQTDSVRSVLEIGPGTGILTGHLLALKRISFNAIEIDSESVAHLQECYPGLGPAVIQGDFLKIDIRALIPGRFAIIGNFPYNISSQIFFRVLEYRDNVQQVVAMVQKEVGERIAAPPGSKTYGILSVLLQAYYNVERLFKVGPSVFAPPPKVMSVVIRLTRNTRAHLDCDEILFFRVVKQAFNNRRKTLRNALKNLNLPAEISTLSLLDSRAEQLSADRFIELTKMIEESRGDHRV